MTRTLLGLLVATLALPCAAAAQDRPNFSGTWKLDPSRSESAVQNEPITTMTQVIAQTPQALTVETTRPDASFSVTYKLDGSDSTLPDGVAKSHWDGNTLVVEAVRTIKGQTITTKQTRRLSDDGNEMLVETTLVVQHGYTLKETPNYAAGRDVFQRVRE